MLFNSILIFVLLSGIKCEKFFQRNYDLNTVLKETNNFFEKLKQDYESESLKENILLEINSKVKEYVQNFSETSLIRHKRKVPEDYNTDINVLYEFEDYGKLSFNEARDLNFFSLQTQGEPLWFAAVLDASELSIFQINGHDFRPVITYPLTNGTKLIVDSYAHGPLIIIQNKDESILVLRFVKNEGNYYLQLLQDLESNEVTHLTVWHGLNQLYLGVASSTNISIFTWFVNYFDQSQVINVGTEKFIPFSSKGFTYLATTGPVTYIFKYLFKSNEFVATQRLPSSQDVSFFQITGGHFAEHFLALSAETGVVIYKEIHDRFVPFQRVSPGMPTVPVISNRAILILSLRKNTVTIHQYDGWRFVELNAKLHEVCQLRQIKLHEKELLLVKGTNDSWSLKRSKWIGKESYKNLQAEIKAWSISAKSSARRRPPVIPILQAPVKILTGHVDQLFVHRINERTAEELENVSKGYESVASKLEERRRMIADGIQRNLTLNSLRARNIKVHCKTACKINRLNVKGNTDPLSRFRMHTDNDRTINYGGLSVKEIPSWKCPILRLPIERVTVNKLINGIALGDLKENTLRVAGDQKITGWHSFADLNVTNAYAPLDIASANANQEVQAREVRVKELDLTAGGFLLPLNNSFATITGSIRAPKVRVAGNVTVNGKLTGAWAKNVLPVQLIHEQIILNRDVALESAKIESLRSQDLIDRDTGSIKYTLSNAILLNDTVPVSLRLSSEKVKWSNVTFNHPKKWIHKDSRSTIAVTGRKDFLRNVKITNTTRESLKYPKIETPLCSLSVIAPEITISTLEINDLDVNGLKSNRIFGNFGEEYFYSNSTSSFKPLDLSAERFYRNLTARNMSVTIFKDVDFTELKRLANSWVEPNTLKSPIEVTDIVINNLQSPAKFDLNLPTVVRDIVSERNINLGTINNVDFAEFLDNMITLDNTMSLGNITFNNGFAANHTYAIDLSLSLTPLEENLNFHKKKVYGNVEANEINLPYSFEFMENDTPCNITVQGSLIFPIEPTIRNINDINLEQLSADVWLSTNDTVLSGKGLHFANAMLKDNIVSPSSTLSLESWKNISGRVLSKTKPQEIRVSSSFNSVKVPSVHGSNISSIKSDIPDFNDMLDNSLVRHKEQKVRAKWTLDKLNVLGNLQAKSRINYMNLKRDVLRNDSVENIVTGKKTAIVLTAENLNGLRFDEFAENSLKRKNKLIIIKGRKTFNTVTFNNITVSGNVMGMDIKEALTKSTSQTILGQKTIQGVINATEIIIDGLMNDVNLTNLMSLQLKREKPGQIIKTSIQLQDRLEIFGNLKIDGYYGKVELRSLNRNYSDVSFAEELEKYWSMADSINLVLRNRAVYVNKFELLKEANITGTSSAYRNATIQEEYCKTETISQLCTNEYVLDIVHKSNTSNLVLIKSIILNGDEFVVWIKFDSVSIYLYDDVEKSLSRLKDLYIPRIIDAFVEPTSHSLWIVLRLVSQTLVLHYQPWKDVHEFVLPATDVFAMSRAPNDQLFLLLSNGIWSLDGLASPDNVLEIPLKDKVETFSDGPNYYVKYPTNNSTALIKARYVGN